MEGEKGEEREEDEESELMNDKNVVGLSDGKRKKNKTVVCCAEDN